MIDDTPQALEDEAAAAADAYVERHRLSVSGSEWGSYLDGYLDRARVEGKPVATTPPVLTTLTQNWDSPLIPGRSGW